MFNNIGADLLTGGESENKDDTLQNKHKKVSFLILFLVFFISVVGLPISYILFVGKCRLIS